MGGAAGLEQVGMRRDPPDEPREAGVWRQFRHVKVLGHRLPGKMWMSSPSRGAM